MAKIQVPSSFSNVFSTYGYFDKDPTNQTAELLSTMIGWNGNSSILHGCLESCNWCLLKIQNDCWWSPSSTCNYQDLIFKSVKYLPVGSDVFIQRCGCMNTCTAVNLSIWCSDLTLLLVHNFLLHFQIVERNVPSANIILQHLRRRRLHSVPETIIPQSLSMWIKLFGPSHIWLKISSITTSSTSLGIAGRHILIFYMS